MRRFARFLTVLSLVVAAATGIAAVAQAAPTEPGSIKYTVTPVGKTVLLQVANGTVGTDADGLWIRDAAGHEALRLPLNYRLENKQLPINTTSAGDHSITLIPGTDLSKATPVSAQAVASARHDADASAEWRAPQSAGERNDQALARFNEQVNAGLTITSIIAVAIGAALGAVLIGGTACVITALIGCIPGLLTGASVGSIVGLILGGGGSLAIAGIQYLQTVTSPFTPPKTLPTPKAAPRVAH